jgi:hypothetical protein
MYKCYILPFKLIVCCLSIRLGQEPPPMPEEKEYDPRSLFEVSLFHEPMLDPFL